MINGAQHQQLLPPPGGNIPTSNGPTPLSSGQSAPNQNSAGTSAAVSRFDSLEQTLEMFVENARHLCVIVSDFPGNSANASSLPLSTSGTASSSSGGATSGNAQAVLNQKLQTLVCGLQELDHVKHNFQDVKIPLELFEQYADAGRNPQLYTKECMERTLNKNKQINGKIELYKKFRAHLLKELSEELPKEAMQYRAIREQATPSSSSSTSGGAYSANGSVVKHEPDVR